LLAWQARLLGVSGFLAADPPSAASGAGEYARALWDHWWRERDRLRLKAHFFLKGNELA